jgi:hypothetical protein
MYIYKYTIYIHKHVTYVYMYNHLTLHTLSLAFTTRAARIRLTEPQGLSDAHVTVKYQTPKS